MKLYLVVVISIIFTLSCYSQVIKPVDQYAVESSSNAKKTGDDKQNFSSILNALGEFTTQDESTIKFQPTLFGLASLFKPSLKKDEHFRNLNFLRNFQLNLGVTPSEKSLFDVDDFQSGFTYAILNNKKFNQHDYQKFINSKPFKRHGQLIVSLNRYGASQLSQPGASAIVHLIGTLTNDGITKDNLGSMPKEMVEFLIKDLGLKDSNDLIAISETISNAYKNLTTEVSKRTLLTIDFNSKYDFTKKGWGELKFTPLSLTKYFAKEKKFSPALNLKSSFSLGTDTTDNELLKRKKLISEAGINFPIGKKTTEKAWLEIKPGIKYTYVANRLYKDEKRNKVDPTLTFRLRINDDFYLPLVLEYDTKDPELLGFLSIQFSLN